jgi:ribosomal protein L5
MKKGWKIYRGVCTPKLVAANNSLALSHYCDYTMADDKSKNIMRTLKVDKLIINCCVGESGDRLTRAAKVIDHRFSQ